MIHYLMNAAIACILFALITGSLGSLIVWRRLTFLGDTLSHASILGVSLSLFFDSPLFIGIFFIDLLIVLYLIYGSYENRELMDTKLAVFSYASIAIGMLLISVNPEANIQFNQFLFGDLLTVSPEDLLYLTILVLTIYFLIYRYYRPIILTWISEELAITYQHYTKHVYVSVLIILTLTISITVKMMGALLITGLMTIPVMTARAFAKTPIQVMTYASLSSVISCIIGLTLSTFYDLPTSSTIISVSFILYILSYIKRIK